MQTALIAIQLEVDERVLASGEAYRRHLEDMVACAVEDAGEADHTLIVLPELAGHLALLAIAPPQARGSKTLSGALAASAVRRPLDVLRGVATTRVLHPRHAVLAALAPDGERFWRSVFGPLARRHAAHVVAGSHLRLAANGDLTNASLLFAPDGRCIATTDKVNLVPGVEDGAPRALGLARGTTMLPIVDTAVGRVATLVGYDGFSSPHTSLERFVPLGAEVAARGGATVVANPSANPWPWQGPWPFEHGGTCADHWQREGLAAGLARDHYAQFGVTAHLVGAVLDLRFDGVSEVVEVRPDGVHVLARSPHHDRGGHVSATVRAKGGS